MITQKLLPESCHNSPTNSICQKIVGQHDLVVLILKLSEFPVVIHFVIYNFKYFAAISCLSSVSEAHNMSSIEKLIVQNRVFDTLNSVLVCHIAY